MPYLENPKTKGSGIVCAIPQEGHCPIKCDDCFFQFGQRSYLEPIETNCPNLPPFEFTIDKVLRINDGNDSNNMKDIVIDSTRQYKMKFYNTSIPKLDFDEPVVLTINPGKMTNSSFHKIEEPPKNLMFVRFRTNTWNLNLCDEAVGFYSKREIPIILTFMAYHKQESIPLDNREQYLERKRTMNTYFAISTDYWNMVMEEYRYNVLVHSCGKVEGELGKTGCRFCGNCLREYFATKERMTPDCVMENK